MGGVIQINILFHIILFPDQYILVVLYFGIALIVAEIVIRSLLSSVGVREIVKIKSLFSQGDRINGSLAGRV